MSKPDIIHLDSVVFPDGLKPGDFIELIGEEGCGKTQFVIHVLANAVLPGQWRDVNIGGFDAGVVFVDTCHSFDVLRLVSVLEQRLFSALTLAKETSLAADGSIARTHASSTVEENEDRMTGELETCVRQCLDKLLIIRCNSTAQWLVTLRSLESLLAARTSVRILIIDSLDGFYDSDKFNKTEGRFTLCINVLQKLAQTYRLVVMASRTRRADYSTHKGLKRTYAGATRTCEDDSEYWNSWRQLVSQRRLLSKYCSRGKLSDDTVYSITDIQKGVENVFVINENGIHFRHLATECIQ